MKTTLLLAVLASTAFAVSASAQSTEPSTGTTTGTGSSEITPSTTGSTGTGTSSSTAGSSAGSQTENPNIYGSTSGAGNAQQSGGRQTGGQPMGSNMTCFSPAPLGGPGSFACYPAEQMGGWGMGMGGMGMGGMGMGGMMGWHHHMQMWNDHVQHSDDDRNSPNWYYQDRQQYGGKQYYDRNRGSEPQGQYDNDWRNQGGDNRYDDNQQQ